VPKQEDKKMSNIQRAINAIKEGKKTEGKTLLAEILHTDPNNERAWLWMSAAVKNPDNKEECLERVLKLNPNNQPAQRSLATLRKKRGKIPVKPLSESTSSSTTATNSEKNIPPTQEEIERQKKEDAERQKKEEELLKLKKLISYELSEGASGRVLIAKYIKKGFPKKSVENLINELDSKLKPVKDDMSLSNLLFSTKGRITRTTYWLFGLAYFILSLIAVFADFMILGGFGVLEQQTPPRFFGIFTAILGLVGFYPALVIQIKRLHDRDRSGWFLLLNFVPFLNLWVGIEIAFLPGTIGQNQYGPDPRQHNRQREEIEY
jgi:uncharacterized membrane protein YhaH (DUF805 family)